ncbi:MAG: Iron-sulfur cluster-binding protein, partial [Acidobacteria bacterium]|nr:Iron-sulfur cluster-binding protein [Acidobacteriota bacterium]
WYGILGGRRNQLHQNIDLSIADLAAFIRPTLTILDAYRVLVSNGPQGGNMNDVKLMKSIAAGTDPVAIDAYGASLLGLRADQLPYLAIAQERGLGRTDFQGMNIKSIHLT